MEPTHDVLILGGGPAGYTAALYCARAGLDTVVLERMLPGGQMILTAQIENYPGFPQGIDGTSLSEQMRQAAEQAGARTRLTEITEVRLRERQVRIPREQLQGRCLILATGAAPRRLDLPGETEWTGRGIHYCATCDGMFYRNKTVLVVGGGNTAVTEALELARLCRRVLLVHRRDRLRAEPGSEERLQRAGVELCWNSTVAALHGDSRLTGVTLQENGRTRRLDCDGVFVAIGRVASTELFQDQLSLAADGSIPAGESTVTEIPGVFAAGDLRQKPLRQIVTATADGATAAYQAIRWCIGQ